MNWRHDRYFLLALILLGLLAYVPTAMPDISASPDPYFADVGSIQDALALSGTLHGSSYPLYAFTGAMFVAALRLIGVAPAFAASLYSTLWGIASLVALYALIVTWLRDRWAALIAAGLYGTGWAFWLFSSYAEVYTPTTFIIILAMWFAVKADQTRQARYLYALAVCCGMSVAHHRAIALALPAPLLIALPALWAQFRRQWSFALTWPGLAVLTGVLPYAYILIRLAQGSNWIWGDPSTLEGLWRLIFGSAYTSIISWPTSAQGWLDLMVRVSTAGLEVLPWPIVLVGLAGTIGLLVRRRFRYGLAMVLGQSLSFVFALSVQLTFIDYTIEDVPALLLTSFVFVLSAWAFLLTELRSRAPLVRRALLVWGAVTCAVLAVQNQPRVYALTRDETGRTYIRAAQRFLTEPDLPENPAFFSIWGGEHWALAYGRYVSGELARLDFLPNRANVGDAADRAGRVYTFEWTLYNRDLEWWRKRLGEVYVTSAGIDTIALAKQPMITEDQLPGNAANPIELGDAPLVLRDWSVRPLDGGRWQVTLYWQATAQPDLDYSVFVHATDRDTIDGPDAIVAQDDRAAPVYGWYPTTRWSPGEIVRDDHVIAPPADRPARHVAVGLYVQDAAGNFRNFGGQLIPLTP